MEKVALSQLSRLTETSTLTKIILALILGLGLLVGVPTAQAASLYFSPPAGQFYKDENFTVVVLVRAEVPINAVQGTVTFPTENLEAVKVERSGINSIIDLWVEKPSFSNAGSIGNVRFEGVVLNPGFVGGEGKIMEVVFRVRKAGAATLEFSDFAILANDGLGTNVAIPGAAANLSLLPARQTPTQPQQDIRVIAEKISSLEEELENLGRLGGMDGGILDLWRILPSWIKFSILTLVGIATLILLFIIVSLGIIVLIWFWSHVWYRRGDFIRSLKLALLQTRSFFIKALVFIRLAEKELAGDVQYAMAELREEIRGARMRPSFRKIFNDYWASIRRIIKRFSTRNYTSGSFEIMPADKTIEEKNNKTPILKGQKKDKSIT